MLDELVLSWGTPSIYVVTAGFAGVLGFWTILAVAPFAIAFAYALYRLIAWERDGALNQLGFVFDVQNEDSLSLPAAPLRQLLTVTAGTAEDNRDQKRNQETTP